MTTHSRSGLRHAPIDGVAEAVVASGQAPVLLLRQDAVDGEPRFSSLVGGRVLALLDGSAFAETALPAALGLARVLESELILFKAIDVYSVPYAVPTELMTVPDLDVQLAWDGSFDVKEAEAYLSLVRRRLKGHAPETPVQIRVQAGDLIEQVRALESRANIGLIVMATRGRSGLAEALRGSTVHDVLGATACPLVVIHSAVRPLADATLSPTLQD
jgi:nucleotide-binding universal stress UspA family protein